MKRLCAIILTFLLLQGMVYALGVSDMAKIQANKLVSTLDLTEEQTEKVEEVIRSQIIKLQAAGDMDSDDPREMMENMRSIDTETQESIKEILTDEQRETLESERVSCLPDRQMIQMNEELDLTETQFVAIDSIYSSMRSQGGPPSGERGGGSPPSGDRDEMREKMEEMNEAIMALLTEEQQEKFEEMLEEQQSRGRPSGGPPGGGPGGGGPGGGGPPGGGGRPGF